MPNTKHVSAAALWIASFPGVSTAVSPLVQTPPAAAAQRATTGGLENPWDVRKIIADLQKDTSDLQPLLREMNPQDWYEKKGAPSTFIVQWQSAQQQLNDVMSVTKQFAEKTENLSIALDTYFRLESLEVAERALGEGAGRYDTPANASRLATLISRNFTARERIRGYIRDLAGTIEENYKIADGEAQRCRATISREPLTNQGRKSKKD